MDATTTHFLVSYPEKSGDYDEFARNVIRVTAIADYEWETDWFDARRPVDYARFAPDDRTGSVAWLVERGCAPEIAAEMVDYALDSRRCLGWNPVTGRGY